MMTGPFVKSAAMLQPDACDEEDELRRYMAEASLTPGARDVATIARLTAALDRIASGRRELTAAQCRSLAREALGLPAVIEETANELCHA